MTINQTPAQVARDQIDARLIEAGWHVQDKNAINLSARLRPNLGDKVAAA